MYTVEEDTILRIILPSIFACVAIILAYSALNFFYKRQFGSQRRDSTHTIWNRQSKELRFWSSYSLQLVFLSSLSLFTWALRNFTVVENRSRAKSLSTLWHGVPRCKNTRLHVYPIWTHSEKPLRKHLTDRRFLPNLLSYGPFLTWQIILMLVSAIRWKVAWLFRSGGRSLGSQTRSTHWKFTVWPAAHQQAPVPQMSIISGTFRNHWIGTNIALLSCQTRVFR